jgi:membrane associated rhomboid family serine protease
MQEHLIDSSPRMLTCYRHPDRETGLRCQRCERPVCPECMVPAPVGVQCVDCVRQNRSRTILARDLVGGSTPYVTYGLIAANVAVWVIGVGLGLLGGGSEGLLGGSSLARLGGLYGPLVAAGQWWRIVTSGFLHSGLLHLAFNMAALFVFGSALERSVGRLRFTTIYVTSLMAGSLGALLLSPGALTIGASGAIFGLFGAILAGQRASGISLRAGGMIPLLVINLVFTIAMPGISVGGHLGGLAGGLAAGALLFNRRLRVGGRAGSLVSVLACLALAAALFAAAVLVAGGGLGPVSASSSP